MSRLNVQMWNELVQRYAMDCPMQKVFGYLGGVQDHPSIEGAYMRNGNNCEQIYYTLADRDTCVEKTRFFGDFSYHRYHGFGQVHRVEYANAEDGPWIQPDSSLSSTLQGSKEVYQRDVMTYDGLFRQGQRHGE